MPTSGEENKATIRKFVREFKNKDNMDIVDELFTKTFRHHMKDPRLPPGREALKFIGRSVFEAFPDVKANIEDLLSDGDKVVERTMASATHKGGFNGVPPTGKPVVWTELHVYRFENGKIAELWSEIDFLGIMTQIGALPAPG